MRGTSVVRLRKLVTFDRLFARLCLSTPDRWILKGALAIEFRTSARGRATKDLDLACDDTPQAALTDLIEAQRIDPGDYFKFSLERTRIDDPEEAGAAVRFRAQAELAGRPFETVFVDIAFSDPPFWTPETVCGPDLLGFAGIVPVEARVLPVEQHLAEKIHAYTREYAGGRRSSRVKDLADILLMKTLLPLDAVRLQRALSETFAARGTHPVPGSLPPPPAAWRTAYRRIGTEVGIAEDLDAAFAEAAAWLAPVLRSESQLLWDPKRGEWVVAEGS
jgi:hypothetical protein